MLRPMSQPRVTQGLEVQLPELVHRKVLRQQEQGPGHRKDYHQLAPGLVIRKDCQRQELEPAWLRISHRPRGLEPRLPEHQRDCRQQEQGRVSRQTGHRPGLAPGHQIHQRLELELQELLQMQGPEPPGHQRHR